MCIRGWYVLLNSHSEKITAIWTEWVSKKSAAKDLLMCYKTQIGGVSQAEGSAQMRQNPSFVYFVSLDARKYRTISCHIVSYHSLQRKYENLLLVKFTGNIRSAVMKWQTEGKLQRWQEKVRWWESNCCRRKLSISPEIYICRMFYFDGCSNFANVKSAAFRRKFWTWCREVNIRSTQFNVKFGNQLCICPITKKITEIPDRF